MKRFKEVKRKGRLGAVEGGGVPAHLDQLPVTFVPWSSCVAGTEHNLDIVQTVSIDYGEIVW